MVKDVRFWIGAVAIGLVVLFTLQNIATVEVSFLLWTVRLPRAILLIFIFAVGVVVGWIFAKIRQRGRQTPHRV